MRRFSRVSGAKKKKTMSTKKKVVGTSYAVNHRVDGKLEVLRIIYNELNQALAYKLALTTLNKLCVFRNYV